MNVPEDRTGSGVTLNQPAREEGRPRRPARWLLPLMVALVGGALWLFRGEANPDRTNLAGLDTAPLSTTTTLHSLEGDLSAGWISVDLSGSGEVVDILDSRFGLLAVAVDGKHSSLWRSDDGITWELVPDEAGVFSGAEVNALVETESGIAAVGGRIEKEVNPDDFAAEQTRPAVWLSGDGAAWERIPDDQIASPVDRASLDATRVPGSMKDVVVWGEHLVAVGWSTSRQHFGAAWVSNLDGRSWKAGPRGLTGSEEAFTEVNAVSVVERRLVAVGTTQTRPVVWVSSDAMTWSIVKSENALGSRWNERPAQVAAGGVGVVAVGVHRRGIGPYFDPPEETNSIIWLSSDSEEWLRMEPEELGGVMLEDVISVQPWLVAAGCRGDGFTTEPGVWFSTTGAEWLGVDLGTSKPGWGESRVNVIVRRGAGLVAGGTLSGNPQVWLWSSDGPVEIPDTVWARQDSGGWELASDLPDGFPVWSLRAIPNGYMAIGDGRVWISPDGVAWEWLPEQEAGLLWTWGWSYAAPVTIDGVVYLVGPGLWSSQEGLWSSLDGRSWEQLGGGFKGRLDGPRPGRDGELLLIESPEHEGLDAVRLWRSIDGVEWIEVPLPELDWVSDIQVVGDSYVLSGRSQDGPVWWVSTQEGRWDPLEFDVVFDPSGMMVTIGDRLVMPVVVDSVEPATRIRSSVDGLTWEMSDVQISGRPGQIIESGPGLVLMTETGEQEHSSPTFTLWSSVDGLQWAELGPLPTYRETRPQILPGNRTVRIVLQWDDHSSLLEWIPPAG